MMTQPQVFELSTVAYGVGHHHHGVCRTRSCHFVMINPELCFVQTHLRCVSWGAASPIADPSICCHCCPTQAWETGKVGWKDENDECRIDLTELGNDPLEVTMEDMDRARDDKNGHGEVSSTVGSRTLSLG